MLRMHPQPCYIAQQAIVMCIIGCVIVLFNVELYQGIFLKMFDPIVRLFSQLCYSQIGRNVVIISHVVSHYGNS